MLLKVAVKNINQFRKWFCKALGVKTEAKLSKDLSKKKKNGYFVPCKQSSHTRTNDRLYFSVTLIFPVD